MLRRRQEQTSGLPQAAFAIEPRFSFCDLASPFLNIFFSNKDFHTGVWFGVVWCGVWCGVVWCGLVWFSLVWCGLVWFRLVFFQEFGPLCENNPFSSQMQ